MSKFDDELQKFQKAYEVEAGAVLKNKSLTTSDRNRKLSSIKQKYQTKANTFIKQNPTSAIDMQKLTSGNIGDVKSVTLDANVQDRNIVSATDAAIIAKEAGVEAFGKEAGKDLAKDAAGAGELSSGKAMAARAGLQMLGVSEDTAVGGAASGAITGAQIGGVPGAIVGGVIGGLSGGLQAKAAAKAKQRALEAKLRAEKHAKLANIEKEKDSKIQRALESMKQSFSRSLRSQRKVRL